MATMSFFPEKILVPCNCPYNAPHVTPSSCDRHARPFPPRYPRKFGQFPDPPRSPCSIYKSPFYTTHLFSNLLCARGFSFAVFKDQLLSSGSPQRSPQKVSIRPPTFGWHGPLIHINGPRLLHSVRRKLSIRLYFLFFFFFFFPASTLQLTFFPPLTWLEFSEHGAAPSPPCH